MEGRRHNSTVTTMVIKELIGREPASGVYLTKQGRAMLEALL
jgi:putative heme iron utilization protein